MTISRAGGSKTRLRALPVAAFVLGASCAAPLGAQAPAAVSRNDRPTDLGAMPGYGATLMAGAEVRTMPGSFDVEKKRNPFHWRVEKPAEGRP